MMTSNENDINWQALSAPFDPADVDFRPQGKPSANGNVQVVAYVDARTVMARLDEACGPDGWSFTWEPIVVERGQVQIAKGRLTIGGVVREDVGEASNFDPSKGCVSDTLKRVAVQFGVARYLYDIERTWVKASGERLSDEAIAHLRAKLPRPDGAQPTEHNKTMLHASSGTLAALVGSEPPTQQAFAARPPVIHAAADEPAATPQPRKFATPDQWTRLRKACELLSIEPPEAPLEYERAENLLHEYMETWKRLSIKQQKAGVR